MSGSLNKVLLIGNLVADPEVKRTSDGRPIANLRVATSERWRAKDSGEWKEKSEFHRVVIFNEGLCKIAECYLRKGSKVYIEGQLQTRKWQDQSGAERFSTEVVLQNFGGAVVLSDSKQNDDSRPSYGDVRSGIAAPRTSYDEQLDDEIPF